MGRSAGAGSFARSWAGGIIGLPASNTSGFPGKRVDPYRAGITTTTLTEPISCFSDIPGNKPHFFTVFTEQGAFVRRCYHTALLRVVACEFCMGTMKGLRLF